MMDADMTTTTADAPTMTVPLGDVDNVEFRGGNLNFSHEQPVSQQQRGSASSAGKNPVSQNPNMITSKYTVNNLFSFKVSRSRSRRLRVPVLILFLEYSSVCTDSSASSLRDELDDQHSFVL